MHIFLVHKIDVQCMKKVISRIMWVKTDHLGRIASLSNSTDPSNPTDPGSPNLRKIFY
jgi:hypothetical protein